MKRTLSGNLLFATRSLLVLVFAVHLTVAVVGYCVLPDIIVSWDHDSSLVKASDPWSKEFFLGLFTTCSVFMFLIGIDRQHFAVGFWKKKQKHEQPRDYWEQEKNHVLRDNICGIHQALMGGTGVLFCTWVLLPYYRVNLSAPGSGESINMTDWYGWAVIMSLFWLIPFVFCPLTLTFIKRYRERSEHRHNADI